MPKSYRLYMDLTNDVQGGVGQGSTEGIGEYVGPELDPFYALRKTQYNSLMLSIYVVVVS